MNKNTAKELQSYEAIQRMMHEKPQDDTLRKHIIRTCIKYFNLKHPDLIKQHQDYRIIMKETAEDKDFAEIGDTGMRAVFTLPERLNTIIRELIKILCKHEPDFCQVEGEDQWFWKEFPQFRISNKF